MKRLLFATLAVSLLGSGVALAQPYQPGPPHGEMHGSGGHGPEDHGPGGHGPEGHGPEHHGPTRYAHEWHRGDHFRGPRHPVDWHHYRLRPPPRGYEWVEDGGQFVLVAIATGVIVDVLLHAQ